METTTDRDRGDVLRRRRVVKDLTLIAVARELGISEATMSRYERGRTAPEHWHRFNLKHRAACFTLGEREPA